MFIFEQNGKTTLHADGRSLLKTTGHAVDNPIVMGDEAGQVIGAGHDMRSMLDSRPIIERLRKESEMTKSMTQSTPVKPVISARNNRYAEQMSDLQNSLSELQGMLKSMADQGHALTQ
jgi:hypothetical protein